MYILKYIDRDAFLYEKDKTRNTGIDPVLELTKITCGSLDSTTGLRYEDTYNSRILLDISTAVSEISDAISSNEIPGTARYYLSLKNIESKDLPISYSINAHLISGSWVNGNGRLDDVPTITNGVSWQYRDSYDIGTVWPTSSWASGTTGSWVTNPGGGAWYTSSLWMASQSFNNMTPDIRMDITNMIHALLSGSVVNHGIIIKRPDADERSNDVFGELKFFGRDSHTIYVPKIEIAWNDVVLSGTGSISEVSDELPVIYFKNTRPYYRASSRTRFRIGVRNSFPTITYVTSSNYLTTYRLPTSSYYQIEDTITKEVIIPFDTSATQISVDSNGNYFDVRFDSFMPERYYKIIIKAEFGNSRIDIFDDGYYFKVIN